MSGLNYSHETISKQLPHTILLVGGICAGKDYIASAVTAGSRHIRMAFADALKQDVANRHNITVADINKHKAVYRRELQEHGENMRKLNPNHWIDRLHHDRVDSGNPPVIITDCRHVNEALWGVTLHNSIVVKVIVPEALRNKRMTALYGEVPPNIRSHASEVECNKCTFNIFLRGDLNENEILSTLLDKINEWKSIGSPKFTQIE